MLFREKSSILETKIDGFKKLNNVHFIKSSQSNLACHRSKFCGAFFGLNWNITRIEMISSFLQKPV